MKIEYIPEKICPKKISFKIQDNMVTEIEFTNGCHGNLQAICQLIEGKSVDEIINQFKGIQCKERGTSCVDQLAIALEINKIK